MYFGHDVAMQPSASSTVRASCASVLLLVDTTTSKDGSALLRELEAFISACHEGLLQKFALPGILDWMKFMRSVSLILLVLGVPPDEPTSFPISRRFA